MLKIRDPKAIKNICRLYVEDKVSTPTLAVMYGVGNRDIHRTLLANGIVLRTRKEMQACKGKKFVPPPNFKPLSYVTEFQKQIKGGLYGCEYWAGKAERWEHHPIPNYAWYQYHGEFPPQDHVIVTSCGKPNCISPKHMALVKRPRGKANEPEVA